MQFLWLPEYYHCFSPDRPISLGIDYYLNQVPTPINNLIIDSFILESDEETGGPGGKALAQLAVFLFTSALNNDSNEGDIHKSSKGKRLVEHDFLGIPPPPKKMAVLNEELDMMLSTPKSGTVQIISIQMLYFSSSMLKIKL